MNNKPVKIAILSCNHGHAKSYYNLREDPLFDLVAVSVSEEYENIVGLELIPDVPRYRSDIELYAAHPELEAVIVGSDNQSHLSQMREAAKRGLHIFSMKVPSFDDDEYREMIELTEKAGVVCAVEMEMRFHAPIYRVKELIDSGAIGKLLSVNFVNYSHNPVWWRPWQCNPEASYGKRVPLRPDSDIFRGGALADHPHVFDAARLITGSSFDTVYAASSPNIREGVETEDMVHLIGKMKNGVIFSIDPSYANSEHHVPKQVDWEKYPRTVEVFMSAVGTEGTIVADLYGKNAYSQRGSRGEYLSVFRGTKNSALGNLMANEFYHCIRLGHKPRVGLREHYETIKAVNAGYESISTGKAVKVNAEL